ncbi:MAG: endonuclease [Desulfobulbaceae bacterium BRH_c16a]|nr:MAG: endonuclease [Desulfobulbaceae bacterium BRH_c16a]
MEEKEEQGEVSISPWYVYIVRCLDSTYYTGITTDLARRMAEHNSARLGARYTRPRRPVVLVYSEPADSRGAAARREYQIKKMTPAGKKCLIETIP